MTDFSTLLANGIPLLVVIFGLVEFIKSYGLKGNWLTGASLFLGLVFGFAYKIAETGVPATFAGWFVMVVFSLALGLTASGINDFANARTNKTGP